MHISRSWIRTSAWKKSEPLIVTYYCRIIPYLCLQFNIKWLDQYTFNSLNTNIRYNDKTRYIGNLNGTNPWFKMRWIVWDMQEGCISYSKKHTLWYLLESPRLFLGIIRMIYTLFPIVILHAGILYSGKSYRTMKS